MSVGRYLDDPAENTAFSWLLLLVGHFLLATLCGMLIGFIPEVFASQLYYNTGLEPYAPSIAVVAFVLGYFVAPRLLSFRAGIWTWIVGLLWLLVGVRELTSYWSASWSPEKTRWGYALANLFGPTRRCSGTECLYELLFTTPFAASVAYSLGVLLRKRRSSPQYRIPLTNEPPLSDGNCRDQ